MFINYNMYSSDDDRAAPTGKAGMPPSQTRQPNRSRDLFKTESSARDILCRGDARYLIPTRAQRKALMIGFAHCGKSLPLSGYDAVRLDAAVDLDDPDDIARNNDAIVIIEIKSTNQAKVGADLAGYFFNITAAELQNAQGLKDQFRFVFLNTVRGDWEELSIGEVLARAKAIYPAYHIKL